MHLSCLPAVQLVFHGPRAYVVLFLPATKSFLSPPLAVRVSNLLNADVSVGKWSLRDLRGCRLLSQFTLGFYSLLGFSSAAATATIYQFADKPCQVGLTKIMAFDIC